MLYGNAFCSPQVLCVPLVSKQRAGLFGDPHITTFDGLHFDCRAAGEFVMYKSLDDPSFQIQERFTAIDSSDSCTQTSVSTGVVIRDTNTPRFQISTPRNGSSFSLNSINSCPIDLYIDGVATSLFILTDDGSTWGYGTYDGSDWLSNYVKSPGNVYVTWNDDQSHGITITHTDTGINLDIRCVLC